MLQVAPEGYIERTPFKRAGVTVVKLEKAAEQPRHRRLESGEEDVLLAHAGPHLYALIVAALETGCRVGELLNLQWRDVREINNVLLMPAKKTKDGEARDVPITARLGAVLDMRRLDPSGRLFGPEAFVFGNELGERVGSFKRAWQTLVLKAHGYTPHWKKGGWTELDTDSNACYRSVDLHFHDLRREFASRLRGSRTTRSAIGWGTRTSPRHPAIWRLREPHFSRPGRSSSSIVPAVQRLYKRFNLRFSPPLTKAHNSNVE